MSLWKPEWVGVTSADELGATLVTAVLVFASTNVDDVVLPRPLPRPAHLRPRTIIAGQSLGIGLLVAVSAIAVPRPSEFPTH